VSQIALYAADRASTARFYLHDLGAPTQFAEVLPLATCPASINRLDYVAFDEPDAEALRRYRALQGIPVPSVSINSCRVI
jgi:hypothetical protein